MPKAKKRNFVIRKISKKRRAEIMEGDLFYFDQGAWEQIMAAALSAGEGAAVGRQSLERLEKAKQTRKRNRLKRQRAVVAERALARRAEFWAKRTGPMLRDRILCAMKPGEWFGAVDVSNAIGAPVRYVRAIFRQVLEPGRLVRSVINPDWKGNVRNVEPEYLWTLTAKGETERAAVMPTIVAGKRYEKRPALVRPAS